MSFDKREKSSTAESKPKDEQHHMVHGNILRDLNRTKSNVEFLLNILQEKFGNKITINNKEAKKLIKIITSADTTLKRLIRNRREFEHKIKTLFQDGASTCYCNRNWVRGLR